MTILSHILSDMPPSATMAMTQKGRDLRAQGVDVISLSVGEPDFDTPEHIKQAAVEALARGETKYTAVDGIIELKDAIIDKFKRDNNLAYDRAQINVSPGGKAVLYNALAATLNPGDEVIIPAPCWVSYPQMVSLLGGVPVIVPCPMDKGYVLQAEDLAAAVTDKTRWLMLNSPSNPTGAVMGRADYQALEQVLADHPQVMVLTDEIYEHLNYSGKFISFAEACPDLYERTLTMNGVSKGYAMTGWRIGYAGGPDWLIRGMGKVMMQTTSNPCSISQWAAVAALSGDQGFLSAWRDVFRTRRDYVIGRINAIDGLDCDVPPGAFYAYISAKGAMAAMGIDGDVALCERLLTEAHIATVPGQAFLGPDAFRLSYATDMDSLVRAMDRLERFVTT